MRQRNALVTGGSRGLGRAMAKALLDRGFSVAVTGRDENKLSETRAEIPGVLTLRADVSDGAQVQETLAEVERNLGPVDILINNAGIGGGAGGPKLFMEETVEDWWRVQETNIKGPMLHCHAVLPGMIDRGFGVIINIGSFIAIRPMDRATAYATSKAALARFSDCLAADLEGTGVQVFCVSPGLVLTDMTRDLEFIKDIPKEAFHQPSDIADRVCRLASGDYAGLSGLFLHVSDDLDVLRERAPQLHEERLYTLRLQGIDGHIP